MHVLLFQRLGQIADIRDPQRPSQPFVQVTPALVDVNFVRDGNQLAALVLRERLGVILLMGLAAGDEEDAIGRSAHGWPSAAISSGLPERKARSIAACTVASLGPSRSAALSQKEALPASWYIAPRLPTTMRSTPLPRGVPRA